MAHLEVDRIIDVVNGKGETAELDHIDGCVECRGEIDAWSRRLPVLESLAAEELASGELHRLRTLYRQLGPSGKQSWIARLVRRSEPGHQAVPDPVRGALSPSFEEYDAGSWSIVLQIRPSDTEARFDIHGQMSSVAGEPHDGGDVVFASDSGPGFRATLDRFGEFRLRAVPAGIYGATWVVNNERIDLTELGIGVSGG
jgi:hypothetical protein